MHNIDRTVGEANYEYNNESYEMNPETYEYSGEYGYENENEDEFLNELNQMEGGYNNETMGEYPGELSNEALEMELATELLGVTNEAELDRFLGSLIKKAAGAVKSFANSSAGKAIGGVLKAAAKKALPIAGAALGNLVVPGAGGMIGSKLGSMASNLFELELEGLSNEDKEFELSRAYVRFATNAVQRAAYDPSSRSNPGMAARNAVISSAKTYAPGLLRKRPTGGRRPQYGQSQRNYSSYNNYDNYGDGASDYNQPSEGSWYRQGNQIIINL